MTTSSNAPDEGHIHGCARGVEFTDLGHGCDRCRGDFGRISDY